MDGGNMIYVIDIQLKMRRATRMIFSSYSFDNAGCILLRYADATTLPVSLSINYFWSVQKVEIKCEIMDYLAAG
jgi:hypothetical protein